MIFKGADFADDQAVVGLAIAFSLANGDTITRHAALSVAADDSQARSDDRDLIDGGCMASTPRWDQYSELVSVHSPLSLFSLFASG